MNLNTQSGTLIKYIWDTDNNINSTCSTVQAEFYVDTFVADTAIFSSTI